MNTILINIEETKDVCQVVGIDSDKKINIFEQVTLERKLKKNDILIGKIQSIEPSLQAAFIDIGDDKFAFLPFNEVHPDYFLISDNAREALKKVVEDTKYILRYDQLLNKTPKYVQDLMQTKYSSFYNISEVLKVGQPLIVQVTKSSRDNKGASLTTFLNIQGRFSVFSPNSKEYNGVSRHIANSKERVRLKNFMQKLQIPAGQTITIRTTAETRSEKEILEDIQHTLRIFSDIQKTSVRVSGDLTDNLIYKSKDVIQKCVDTYANVENTQIYINNEVYYNNIKKSFKREYNKSLHNLHLSKEPNLLRSFDIHEEVEAINSPVVALKSKGEIVFSPTEALTSIDVNSGSATNLKKFEESTFTTNLEAAQEIARQIILKNISGIIVIDFIDMNKQSHIELVEKEIAKGLLQDNTKTYVGKITKLGLLEISRQRNGPSVFDTMNMHCDACNGTGFKTNYTYLAMSLIRKLKTFNGRNMVYEIIAPAKSLLYIMNNERDLIKDIESQYDVQIIFTDNENINQSDVTSYHKSSSKTDTLDANKSDTIYLDPPAQSRQTKQSNHTSRAKPSENSKPSARSGVRKTSNTGLTRKTAQNSNQDMEKRKQTNVSKTNNKEVKPVRNSRLTMGVKKAKPVVKKSEKISVRVVNKPARTGRNLHPKPDTEMVTPNRASRNSMLTKKPSV